MNAAKQGVTFEEATTVFLDLDYLLVGDDVAADRFAAIGMSTTDASLSCTASGSGSSVRGEQLAASAKPI